jgi:hypothetical protein
MQSTYSFLCTQLACGEDGLGIHSLDHSRSRQNARPRNGSSRTSHYQRRRQGSYRAPAPPQHTRAVARSNIRRDPQIRRACVWSVTVRPRERERKWGGGGVRNALQPHANINTHTYTTIPLSSLLRRNIYIHIAYPTNPMGVIHSY